MNNRKVSMYLSKWCKANGFECGVRYGEDFAYYFNRSFVQYSWNSDEEQDQIFKKVCLDEGLELYINNFIVSFFHELGHLETDDNWSEAQSNKFMEYKSNLDGYTVKGNLDYFYCDDEIMATRWGIDYINEHQEEVEELWKNIKKLKENA